MLDLLFGEEVSHGPRNMQKLMLQSQDGNGLFIIQKVHREKEFPLTFLNGKGHLMIAPLHKVNVQDYI